MKTLIADNDPMARLVLQRMLTAAGCEIVNAGGGEEALEILQEADPPRFALLGFRMSGMSGVEVVKELREGAGAVYTYTILLVTEWEKSQVMEGIAAGADDYLIKPIDPQALTARLVVAKRILKLQDQLLAAAKQAVFIADHDGLTGLYNHNAIVKALRREMSRSARAGNQTAVLMLDVDFFKKINDTHGHFVGDCVLEEVASRISHAVRPYDVVGRFGGEEFIVVAPNCDAEEGMAFGERIRQLIAAEPIHAGGVQVPVTISVGVALGSERPEPVLHSADEALYRAKKAGRNRVELGKEEETKEAAAKS